MTESQHSEPAPAPRQAHGNKGLNVTPVRMPRLEDNLDRMLERVSALVRMESPTSEPQAVEAVQKVVAGWAGELGGACRSDSGGVLEIRFGHPGKTRKPVLLLGHLDT